MTDCRRHPVVVDSFKRTAQVGTVVQANGGKAVLHRVHLIKKAVAGSIGFNQIVRYIHQPRQCKCLAGIHPYPTVPAVIVLVVGLIFYVCCLQHYFAAVNLAAGTENISAVYAQRFGIVIVNICKCIITKRYGPFSVINGRLVDKPKRFWIGVIGFNKEKLIKRL